MRGTCSERTRMSRLRPFTVSLLGIGLGIGGIGVVLAEATESAATSVDDYRQLATALLDRMVDGSDAPALVSDAQQLVDAGASMVPAFVQRHPHCAAYLDAALQVVEKLPTLDAESIERDYHEDAALPKTDNVAVCYHMKDLFVHPASVVAMLRDAPADLQDARREIQEVLAHLHVVDSAG
jgi:hypothetical protein